LIEQQGSNIWFEKSAADLWALVKPADGKGLEAVAKSSDTLDVWIDSGSSSRAVLMRRAELSHSPLTTGHSPLSWQADMYLEGSDQHRGWFQSSLLLSLAGNGVAPFKTVLTHGFMVDADREKISKSKQGGYEKPQTAEAYVKKYGADVVRLWVASQDFRNDIIVSEERINKVGETYRGIRNALRYQLSNLYDFDPAKHTFPEANLTGLDRWILGEFAKLEAEVIAAYDRYEFHVVYQKVSQFVAVELSSIYHDIIKDRLYTDPCDSLRRRSTQTALNRLVRGLTQMLSPILVFTTAESWEFAPGAGTESVHQSTWLPQSLTLSETERATWQALFKVRERALLELERARESKLIGKSLEAALTVEAQGNAVDTLHLFQSNQEALKEILNISQISVAATPAPPRMESGGSETELFSKEVILRVQHAAGKKCERCWHWETDIGLRPEFPTICGRCVEAVERHDAKNEK